MLARRWHGAVAKRTPSRRCSSTSTLPELLRVPRIVFVRHAKTNSIDEAGSDLARALTSAGWEQCRLTHNTWLPLVQARGPIHQLVLSSSAQRCEETAKGILGREIEWRGVEGIYDGSLQPQGSELFERFSYNSLRVYHDGGGKDFLDAWAASVVEAMQEEVADLGPSDATLFVFGHSIYNNALALRLAELMGLGEAHRDLILDTSLQETDGFLLDSAGANGAGEVLLLASRPAAS